MPPASHDTTDSPVFVNWNSSPLTKAAWVFAFERRTQSNPQYQQYVLFGVDYIKTLMIVRSEEHCRRYRATVGARLACGAVAVDPSLVAFVARSLPSYTHCTRSD